MNMQIPLSIIIMGLAGTVLLAIYWKARSDHRRRRHH
jgi:hypothetical protein